MAVLRGRFIVSERETRYGKRTPEFQINYLFIGTLLQEENKEDIA
jgi:hypothetical protein